MDDRELADLLTIRAQLDTALNQIAALKVELATLRKRVAERDAALFRTMGLHNA